MQASKDSNEISMLPVGAYTANNTPTNQECLENQISITATTQNTFTVIKKLLLNFIRHLHTKEQKDTRQMKELLDTKKVMQHFF